MALQDDFSELSDTKNASTDRILVLNVIPGRDAKNNLGLVDKSLFTGGNQLHAIQQDSGLWSLKYEKGALPEPLKQQFTGFNILLRFCKTYFEKRNLEITEVKS